MSDYPHFWYWKKQTTLLSLKEQDGSSKKLQTDQCHLNPREVREQILVGAISKHYVDKKVICISQHGYIKGK